MQIIVTVRFFIISNQCVLTLTTVLRCKLTLSITYSVNNPVYSAGIKISYLTVSSFMSRILAQPQCSKLSINCWLKLFHLHTHIGTFWKIRLRLEFRPQREQNSIHFYGSLRFHSCVHVIFSWVFLRIFTLFFLYVLVLGILPGFVLVYWIPCYTRILV